MPMHFFSFRFLHAAAQLHFPFSFSGGLGNAPTSGICGIVFIQWTLIPCLLLFGIFLTGQIHLSGTRTKIKGIKIENLFLYKNKKKNSQLDFSNRQIFHIGTLAYYFLQSLTYNKTDNDTVTVKVSRPDRINPAGQLALTVSNRPWCPQYDILKHSPTRAMLYLEPC